MKNNQHEPILV